MSSIDEFAIPNTIIRHFDLSSTPWNEFTAPDIESRRKRLPNGKLFFDRLLELVGLEGPSLYPPNTPAALRRLLHSIHSLELDRLKKDCFLYYLLKDYDTSSSSSTQTNSQPPMDIDESTEDDLTIITKLPNGANSEEGKALGFAKRRCMPLTWKRFMDGYWALDHGLWETAVSSLSDPSITTLNFVPSILQTLSQHVSPPSHSLSLIHNFLISTHPELTTQEENDIRLIALASAGSISQAFSLIRSNSSEEGRKRERENLWCWLLGSPKISCGLLTGNVKTHQIQSNHLKQLLHLPLSFEENQHLIEFLKRPPIRYISSKALSILHDLITLRLIHQGQYSESLLLDKQLVGTGGNAEQQYQNQKRREMVREFISILPEAQRNALILDVESKKGDVQSHNQQQFNDSGNDYNQSGEGQDTDMSSSWVQVTSNGPSYAEIASEPPTIPIPSIVPPQEPTPTTTVTETPALAPAPAPIPSAAAPTQTRPSTTHTSLFNAAQNAPLPSSPQKPASPFSGPPRFAAGASSSSAQSPRRVLSGSPFTLPASSSSKSLSSKARGSPALTPKLPKTIINDDDEELDDDERSVLGRRGTSKGRGRGRLGRGVSASVEPENPKENYQQQGEEGMSLEQSHPIKTISEEPSSSKSKEPPRSIRRSRRVVSSTSQRERENTSTPPPPDSRNAPVTPGLNGMPGSFLNSHQTQSHSDEEMPPPQSTTRPTRESSNVPESVRKSGRSRITRSASRAVLDEDESQEGSHDSNRTPGPPAKKTKSTKSTTTGSTRRNPRSSLAPSEITDDGTSHASVRRSTRSRTGTVQPSEQGSPTPSLGGRSEVGSVAGASRRRTTRAGSATPRMSTRTSKRG